MRQKVAYAINLVENRFDKRKNRGEKNGEIAMN